MTAQIILNKPIFISIFLQFIEFWDTKWGERNFLRHFMSVFLLATKLFQLSPFKSIKAVGTAVLRVYQERKAWFFIPVFCSTS